MTVDRRPTGINEHPRDAWTRGVAWLTVGVTVTMVTVSVVLVAPTSSEFAHPVEKGRWTELTPLISVFIGAFIIQRKGNHPVGWLFCASGFVWALYHLGLAGGTHVAEGDQIFAGSFFVWATTWTSFVAFGIVPTLVIFLFPSGRLTTPRWRGFFRFAIGVVVAGGMAYGLASGPTEDLPILDNPWGLPGTIGQILMVAREIAWPLLLVSIFGGVVSLRQRMRAAAFEERQQIKWLLLAGVTLVLFVALWGIEDTLGDPRIAVAAGGLVLPLLGVAVAIAILRHRLYDIDVLINRTLVYASLSAVLAITYLGTVVVLQRVLSTFTADSNVAIAASTLAVAALFRPARTRIQGFIDRRFYRQKYDAAATVGRFSTRLRHEVDLDALEGELLGVIGQTLQPATAAVWLKTSEPAQ